MKIGIITLPLHYNYGGILQAYALQTILERMGHEAEIVRQSQIRPMPRKAWLRYTKRLVMKMLHGGKGCVFSEKLHNDEFPLLTAKTWKFVDRYIHSHIIKSYSDILESSFDAFVVGSDQVWRSGFLPSVLPFFLNFAEGWNVKRIAYAASFGLDKWSIDPSETEECIRLAGSFNAISVREEGGLNLCKNVLKVNASLVLDPTMLLTMEDYSRIIEEEHNERCLTTYILDENPDKKMIIETIKKERNLPQVKLFTKEHYKIQPLSSIGDWLNSFRISEFVFTDSFHGAVFSILFNKQFVVFANEHRGTSRMESLLNLLGLKNRLVHSYDDYIKLKDEIIDYCNVNAKLDAWRKKSIVFLNEALG